MGLSVRLVATLRDYSRIFVPLFMLVFLACPATAQQSSRTVIDFQVKEDRLLVEITLNAEALLAEIDPQDVSKEAVGGSARYAQLRRLVSSELEPLVHEHVTDWKQTLRVDANGRVELSYEGAQIPVVGNPDVPRLTRVLLAGNVPSDASALRLSWPQGAGPVVVRQQGVDAPYTGYLNGGEVSPRIPLKGGAGLGAQQAAEAYFRAGLAYVSSDGSQLLALGLVLVFLSLGLRPLVLQLLAFSVGVLVALPLGMFVVIPVAFLDNLPILPVALAVLALWNLGVARLGGWRLMAVFATGAFLGLNLSVSLSQLGVPPHHVAPALLGYAAGILLALAGTAGFVFAVVTVLLPDAPRLRGRISTVASLLLIGVGGYWAVLPFVPL